MRHLNDSWTETNNPDMCVGVSDDNPIWMERSQIRWVLLSAYNLSFYEKYILS